VRVLVQTVSDGPAPWGAPGLHEILRPFQGSNRMTATVSGLNDCSWDTGVQAMQLSPCHPGLAGRAAGWLHGTPAFPTGCCPLRLSRSGRSGDPGALLGSPWLLSLSPCGFRLAVGWVVHEQRTQLLLCCTGFNRVVTRRTLIPFHPNPPFRCPAVRGARRERRDGLQRISPEVSQLH